jgi:hypothetical protein
MGLQKSGKFNIIVITTSHGVIVWLETRRIVVCIVMSMSSLDWTTNTATIFPEVAYHPTDLSHCWAIRFDAGKKRVRIKEEGSGSEYQYINIQ